MGAYEGDDGAEIQSAAYAVGKAVVLNLREFFRALYRLLLGQEDGPRLGTFIGLYGVQETVTLARARLAELGG